MNKQQLLDYIVGKILPELEDVADPVFLKLLLKVAELKRDEPATSLLDEDLATP